MKKEKKENKFMIIASCIPYSHNVHCQDEFCMPMFPFAKWNVAFNVKKYFSYFHSSRRECYSMFCFSSPKSKTEFVYCFAYTSQRYIKYTFMRFTTIVIATITGSDFMFIYYFIFFQMLSLYEPNNEHGVYLSVCDQIYHALSYPHMIR